jgi:hypothetical protein
MMPPLFLNALTHQAVLYGIALPRHYSRGIYMYVYRHRKIQQDRNEKVGWNCPEGVVKCPST